MHKFILRLWLGTEFDIKEDFLKESEFSRTEVEEVMSREWYRTIELPSIPPIDGFCIKHGSMHCSAYAVNHDIETGETYIELSLESCDDGFEGLKAALEEGWKREI